MVGVMTTRRSRPHPARTARRTAGAASVAGMLVLTGAMAGHAVQGKTSSAAASTTPSSTSSSASSLITAATAAQPSRSVDTSSHGS
jgi:hypothetical protein